MEDRLKISSLLSVIFRNIVIRNKIFDDVKYINIKKTCISLKLKDLPINTLVNNGKFNLIVEKHKIGSDCYLSPPNLAKLVKKITDLTLFKLFYYQISNREFTASFNEKYILDYACYSGSLPIVSYLVNHENFKVTSTAMIGARQSKNQDLINYISKRI